MRITRIYTGDDGESHFEEIEVAFALDVGRGVRTPLLDAAQISLHESTAAFETDYHPAPHRQWVITVSGSAEIECGDGSKRTFGVGDVFFADDTTGRGHIARTVEVPRRSIVVPMPEDFDFEQLRGEGG